MRSAKEFGFTAIAALITIMFLNINIASAQEHKIVLCKQLVTLCGSGDLWPSLTKIFWLAKDIQLHTSIGLVLCDDSIVTAELSEEIGSPLKTKNITAAWGALPTPTLGEGCKGVCVESGGTPNKESIHITVESMEFILEPEHKYSLRLTGLLLLLNCPFVGTCVYRGVNVVAPIKHDGLHEAHNFGDPLNLPLADFSETLNRQVTHGGSVFCPSTATCLANYVLYLAKSPSSAEGLAWPALDK